jgi:hypothetical protein
MDKVLKTMNSETMIEAHLPFNSIVNYVKKML